MAVDHIRRIFGAIILALSALSATAAAAKDGRPNIVLIVVEDLSPRIGAFGDTVARTPHLDLLAREGIRFTQVFTTAGVCAPSRSALITGMYQHTIGTMHMRTGSYDRILPNGFKYQAVPPPYVKGFPEYLRAAGYFTMNNSKTDYQFGDPSSIWDLSGDDVTLAARDPEKPFFLMVSDGTTHESGLFMPGRAPRQPGDPMFAYRADEIAANAARNARENAKLAHRTNPADVVVPPYLPDTLPVRQEIAQQYDNVQRMDANVGAWLRQLEEAGLSDNTIVIWTTDHGDGITRAKRSLYDSGLHVPMIVRFPDERGAGTVRGEMVTFVDLAPTILSLASVRIPDHLQGQVFIGHAMGAPRQYVFAARDRLDEFPDYSRAVRDERYKYIRNGDIGRPLLQPLDFRENLASMQEMRRLLAAGDLPPAIAAYFQTPRPREELFDLQSDPHEIRNLAENSSLAAVKERLSVELDGFLRKYGDWGLRPEHEMIFSRMWPGGIQPLTAEPVAGIKQVDALRERVTISSQTEGASIEYRILGNERQTDERWHLYVAPLSIKAGTKVEARAIRYGFKPSKTVVLTHQEPVSE